MGRLRAIAGTGIVTLSLVSEAVEQDHHEVTDRLAPTTAAGHLDHPPEADASFAEPASDRPGIGGTVGEALAPGGSNLLLDSAQLAMWRAHQRSDRALVCATPWNFVAPPEVRQSA